MVLAFIYSIVTDGPPAWIARNRWAVLYSTIAAVLLFLLKKYTSGATNTAERPLHGKVVLLTGGTSGIGAQVAQELASRGAQLVLLTQTAASDPFLADYVQDLRDRNNNHLIYAEQVDLASLHSIRKFATKWIDNAPPRRLDMVILCAATLTPPGGERKETVEGVEETWMVNYLANFHLLGTLSPAIRAQPFDRDVRIIMATCPSYIRAPPLTDDFEEKTWAPGKAYARSKLALNVFGTAFQKHLDSYKRPDGLPMNSRVIFVDPGYCRTPGMWRWLTRGSLTGLAIYLATYAVPWFLLKPPNKGAQSFLHAVMDGDAGRGEGGKLIKECMQVDFARTEVQDDEVAKKLWEETDALIERVEKATAKRRASQKKEKEKEKSGRDRDERERSEDTESIRKGKSKDKEKEKEREKKKEKEREKERREKEKKKEKDEARAKRRAKRDS